MGTIQSQPTSIPVQTYHINHPVLNQAKLLLSSNQMITTFYSYLYSQSQFQSWLKATALIKQMNPQQLLLPQHYQIRYNQQICGSQEILNIVYPCFPYVLMDQIKNRRKMIKQFEEDEVWYLLWALAHSSKLLMSNGYKIGDIRPQNILFNETGDIKIINELSWPGQSGNLNDPTSLSRYFSPQQIDNINKGRNIETSISKCQSFSVGLTLLSVLYLQDLSYLYFYSNDQLISINTSLLIQKLQSVHQLSYLNPKYNSNMAYSHQLLRIVCKLCEVEQNQRLDILIVYEWLLPYQKYIVQFRQFQFSNQSELSSSWQRNLEGQNNRINSSSKKTKIGSNSINNNAHNYGFNSYNNSPVRQLNSLLQSPNPSHNSSLINTLRNTLNQHSPIQQCPSEQFRSRESCIDNMTAQKYHPRNVQKEIEQRNYTYNYVNNYDNTIFTKIPSISDHRNVIGTQSHNITYSTPMTTTAKSDEIYRMKISPSPPTPMLIPTVSSPNYQLHTNFNTNTKIEQTKVSNDKLLSTQTKKLKTVDFADDDDLLCKIQQQLIKSRMLFPS